MFGTTAILKPRSGQEAAVVDHINRWWKDRAPRTRGVLLGTVARNLSNPAELLMTVAFTSKASYEENAADPEQDSWFQQLAALLEEEPHWMDGDLLAIHSRGAI